MVLLYSLIIFLLCASTTDMELSGISADSSSSILSDAQLEFGPDYQVKMGFEAELPNLRYPRKTEKIAHGDGWTLDTDTLGDKFDLEYTSDAFDVTENTLDQISQNISAHFIKNKVNPEKELDLTKEVVKGAGDKINPQITFQMKLELIPLLFRHLYIISGRNELKELIFDGRYSSIFFSTELSKVNGILALFILYVNQLFYKESFPSAALTADLKGRLPIMSRFSFSKMYASLTEQEKIDFVNQVNKLFGEEQLTEPKVIVYVDYRQPGRKHFLYISIQDWLDSIVSPKKTYEGYDSLRKKIKFTLKTMNTQIKNKILKIKISANLDAIRSNEKRPAIVIFKDIFSPPRDLGECDNDLGMGAGDSFPNLEDKKYGEALIEIRLYGEIGKQNEQLTIGKLPQLISAERIFMNQLLTLINADPMNYQGLIDIERKAAVSFSQLFTNSRDTYNAQAQVRIREIMNKIIASMV